MGKIMFGRFEMAIDDLLMLAAKRENRAGYSLSPLPRWLLSLPAFIKAPSSPGGWRPALDNRSNQRPDQTIASRGSMVHDKEEALRGQYAIEEEIRHGRFWTLPHYHSNAHGRGSGRRDHAQGAEIEVEIYVFLCFLQIYFLSKLNGRTRRTSW